MTPEVAVVIPTHNRLALLLDAALRSALAQEDVKVEVIVVDDGSTDDTTAVLESLHDERVRALRHAVPRGVAAARNTGIGAASAPWIAFLDDDDLWSPRKLRTQLDALSRVDADFAYTGVVVVDERRQPTAFAPPPEAATLGQALRRRNVLTAGSSSVVAATGLVERAGGFDERFPLFADWDCWVRLLRDARPVACEDVLVAYVRHAGRMALPIASTIDEVRRLRAEHGRDAFDPDDESFLTWVAAEHRRGGRRADAAAAYVRAAVAGRAPVHLVRAALTVGGRRTERPAATVAPLPAPDWLAKW